MFDRLRHRLKEPRRRRQIHRATAHLDAHTLRDIGLDPMACHHGRLLPPGPRH